MSYHWFKKMLLSTSILILSSSSLGLATHTVEAKDNLNGEKPTTNLNHNITSPSVNSEMNNNETGHLTNQIKRVMKEQVRIVVMLILIRIM